MQSSRVKESENGIVQRDEKTTEELSENGLNGVMGKTGREGK
jgi:hypothetical protein